MALDITQSVDIIDLMETYIAGVRPKPEIRHKVDLGYELEGQSVVLTEIRPAWDKPGEMRSYGYARATFNKAKNNWKVYWQRADGKWHGYEPCLTVGRLEDFLKVVDEDKYHCFKG